MPSVETRWTYDKHRPSHRCFIRLGSMRQISTLLRGSDELKAIDKLLVRFAKAIGGSESILGIGMRLTQFIRTHPNEIEAEWEKFAKQYLLLLQT
jgi:hypothetical protein